MKERRVVASRKIGIPHQSRYASNYVSSATRPIFKIGRGKSAATPQCNRDERRYCRPKRCKVAAS